MAASNSVNMDQSGIQTFNSTTGDLTGSTVTNHGVLVGGASNAVSSTATGSSGQVLQSGGASADPTYSTATYPATAGTTGNVLTSDGTNWTSAASATASGAVSFSVTSANTSTGGSPVTGYIVLNNAINGAAAPSTAFSRIYATTSYTLNTVYGVVTTAAAGSNENCTVFIRKNNSTDTNVTTTLQITSTENTFSGTSLGISLVAGDYVSVGLTTPGWSSPPTGIQMAVTISG